MKRIKTFFANPKTIAATSLITRLLLFIPVMLVVILGSWFLTYTLLFFKPIEDEKS